MSYIVIAVILLVGITGFVVASINFKNLKKHSREGRLGIQVGTLLLALETVLCVVALIVAISFFASL